MLTRIKQKASKLWNKQGPEGAIFRNMAKLATGAGIARVIALLTAPVITRIYTPEHFGVLLVFTALTGMMVPFGTLRYSMAIPLPKNDGLATNLMVLCLVFLLPVSVLVFVLFWLFAPAVLGLLGMEQLMPWWWLIPLAIAGTGLYELLSNWAVREKAFGPLAKTQVWQKIIGSVVKIGMGLAGFKPLGLLIGQIFTQAGGIFSLIRAFRKKLTDNLRFVKRKRINFLFQRFSEFPKYRLPSQVLMSFATKVPLLFFAWHFGSEITGYFGLAMIILMLPMSLFGQTTGKAYYGEIAKIGRKDPEKILKVTKNITKRLFLISLPPFFILLLFGPWLFQTVFGEVWRESGVFASILAINLLTMFVANPVTHALTVMGRQLYYLQINTIRLFLVLAVFFMAYMLNLNPYLSLLAYSLAMSLHRSFVYFRILQIIKSPITTQ